MIQAYNYMLDSLPIKRSAKYPISKRSELKKVYEDIVDLSKRSPFYKVNLSKENQEYTFGMKESVLALKAKINDMADPEISGFNSKTVTVSDEKILSAQLISDDTEGLPEVIQFKINSLAGVQINRGKELLSSSRGLSSGEYKLKVLVGDEAYTLTYIQDTREENKYVLYKMADFLNQSIPGINSFVEKGSSKDYFRLAIAANIEGRFGDKRLTFEDVDIYNQGVVEYLGMNRMEQAPTYAMFELNEVAKYTTTNAFTLENKLRIHLHNNSEQPVTLKIVPDKGKILTAVEDVITSYNELIHLAKNRLLNNSEHYKASKLINEMKNLEEAYKNELTSCGLVTAEDGGLVLEDSLAVQAAEDGGMEDLFSRKNGFIARLLDKVDNIAINPMEYIEKTVVTYPNNKNTYRNPYVTSMYSGLFFSSYC